MKNETLQEHAASLVQLWGNTVLANGTTVRDRFVIDEISLWDVIAPILAVDYVPRALSMASTSPSFLQWMRPYLSACKAAFQDSLTVFKRDRFKIINWPEEPYFLFLGFNEYMHRDVLQPIETELHDKNYAQIVRLCDFSATGNAIPLEVNRQKGKLDNDATAVICRDEKRLREKLNITINDINRDGSFPEVVRNSKISLWPQLRNDFNRLFLVILPRLMRHMAIARYILINKRPRLVFSPDVADPRTRIFCLLARQLRIPSIEVQFGLYDSESVAWRFFVADQIAVWGETSCGVMLGHGVPANKIVITGSPRHDIMAKSSGYSDTDTQSISGPVVNIHGTYTILFASTYSLGSHDTIDPEALKSTKKAVFSLSQLSNCRLIVKPHPLEDSRELQALTAGRHRIAIADPAEDIRDLIKKCDCFITLGSTATADAIIARKLIIQPIFDAMASCSDVFSKSGAIIVVNSIEEMYHIIEKASLGTPEDI